MDSFFSGKKSSFTLRHEIKRRTFCARILFVVANPRSERAEAIKIRRSWNIRYRFYCPVSTVSLKSSSRLTRVWFVSGVNWPRNRTLFSKKSCLFRLLMLGGNRGKNSGSRFGMCNEGTCLKFELRARLFVRNKCEFGIFMQKSGEFLEFVSGQLFQVLAMYFGSVYFSYCFFLWNNRRWLFPEWAR